MLQGDDLGLSALLNDVLHEPRPDGPVGLLVSLAETCGSLVTQLTGGPEAAAAALRRSIAGCTAQAEHDRPQ